MSVKVREWTLILALAGLVFVGNLGGTKLWDEDELQHPTLVRSFS